MLKLERPLIVLDVETTGTDVNEDRVISLAWEKLSPDGSREARAYLFHPGRSIPPESTAVHGIGDDDVADAMPFFRWAKDIGREWYGCDVGGFNVRSFDLPILHNEFKAAGVPWPFEGAKVVDAHRSYRRMEPHTLGAACRLYLGREIENAHDASADVAHTLDVILAQAERYDATTLDALAELERDPDWLDDDGKFRTVNGVTVITIGKQWAGRPLAQVDDGFLRWMLGAEFADDTKTIVRNELGRREAEFRSQGGLHPEEMEAGEFYPDQHLIDEGAAQ